MKDRPPLRTRAEQIEDEQNGRATGEGMPEAPPPKPPKKFTEKWPRAGEKGSRLEH